MGIFRHGILFIGFTFCLNFINCQKPMECTEKAGDEDEYLYFKRGEFFKFEIYDSVGYYYFPWTHKYLFSPHSTIARYLGLSNDLPNRSYDFPNNLVYSFFSLDSNKTIKVLIGVKDTIKFIKDTLYYIIQQGEKGMGGYSSGLLINKNNSVIFFGIREEKMKDDLILYDSSDIKIEINKIYKNYFLYKDGYRLTNIELLFYNNTDSLLLVQGMSGHMGNYTINLGVAIKGDYIDYECDDCEPRELSFTIIRQTE